MFLLRTHEDPFRNEIQFGRTGLVSGKRSRDRAPICQEQSRLAEALPIYRGSPVSPSKLCDHKSESRRPQTDKKIRKHCLNKTKARQMASQNLAQWTPSCYHPGKWPSKTIVMTVMMQVTLQKTTKERRNRTQKKKKCRNYQEATYFPHPS